jgi:hypothetical protein
MTIQAKAESIAPEIEIYRHTICRFCNSKIFLYNRDLGEFVFRTPFDSTTGRRHYCPNNYEMYLQYQQHKEQQPQYQKYEPRRPQKENIV